MPFQPTQAGRAICLYKSALNAIFIRIVRSKKSWECNNLCSKWSGEHLRHVAVPWLEEEFAVSRPEIKAGSAHWEHLQFTHSLGGRQSRQEGILSETGQNLGDQFLVRTIVSSQVGKLCWENYWAMKRSSEAKRLTSDFSKTSHIISIVIG